MNRISKQLWFQVMIGMILGVICGLLLSPSGAGWLSETIAQQVAPWVALPGNLFLALIKMVVIPLVLTSIILGITSSEDTGFLKKVSLRIFPYFVGTTIIATSLGAGIAQIAQPGKYIDSKLIADVMEGSPSARESETPPEDIHITDRLVALVPTNYIKSALDQDMLATVILALFMGMAMVAIDPEKTRTLSDLIQTIQAMSMTIIEWAMKLAPIAVFGLITNIRKILPGFSF